MSKKKLVAAAILIAGSQAFAAPIESKDASEQALSATSVSITQHTEKDDFEKHIQRNGREPHTSIREESGPSAHVDEMRDAQGELSPAALMLGSITTSYTQYSITSRAKISNVKNAGDYTKRQREATLKVIDSLKQTAKDISSEKGQQSQIIEVNTTEKDGWVYGSAKVLVVDTSDFGFGR